MIENKHLHWVGKDDNVLYVLENKKMKWDDIRWKWNEPGRRTFLQLHGKTSKKGSSNTQKVAKNSVSKYNWKDLCDNANVIYTENRLTACLGKENWYRNHFSLPDEQHEFFGDLFDIDYECHLKFCSPS